MENIKNVAVLYGGSSAEREVSLKSGRGVAKGLSDLGIKSTLFDFSNLNNFSQLQDFDISFIALHGHEGEGGLLQKTLDSKNIKYTGSGEVACSKTWNKRICKELLFKENINTPKWVSIDNLKNYIDSNSIEQSYQTLVKKLGKSMFLKPSEDGSSIDIFKIDSFGSFKEAILNCSNINREFILEESINGREITVGIIKDKCLPAIEIQTKNVFYNYEAKYLSDDTNLKEADISNAQKKKIQKMALSAFNTLGCKGWARVDFMQDIDGEFYIIEINTAPGMTSHSLIPMAASFLGISYPQVIKDIINASI